MLYFPLLYTKKKTGTPFFNWQRSNDIKIHIWHIFYDGAYGLSLDEAQRLIDEGLIELTIQTFQAPGGATTKKGIYNFYHQYAYPVGISERPSGISTREYRGIENKFSTSQKVN